jgi:hypothetical protein
MLHQVKAGKAHCCTEVSIVRTMTHGGTTNREGLDLCNLKQFFVGVEAVTQLHST